MYEILRRIVIKKCSPRNIENPLEERTQS